MTGPDDDGPTGIFDHLDDPGAPTPRQEMLTAVVHRGRRMRARRQSAIAMSGAAAVTAAVLGGLGIAHAVNAGGQDRLLNTTPANSSTPTVSASTGAGRHHSSDGVAIVAPHGRPASSPASPTMPPSPGPCGTPVPSSSPSPLVNGPIVESSVPPLLPTASPEPCASESPGPSESPTPGESSTPTPSETPTTEPSPSAD
jgi:hypothetical protein